MLFDFHDNEWKRVGVQNIDGNQKISKMCKNQVRSDIRIDDKGALNNGLREWLRYKKER